MEPASPQSQEPRNAGDPRAPRPPGPPRHDSVSFSVASRGASRGVQLAWVAVLVVVAGAILHLGRGAVLAAIDRGFLAPGVVKAKPREGTPITLAAARPYDAASPTGVTSLAIDDISYWTPGLATERLDPLPEVFDQLIATGRGEIPSYRRVRAELFANRWNPWRTSWRNRVAPVRDRMPPVRYCRQQAELLDRCTAFHGVADTLYAISDSESVVEAGEGFDLAGDQLKTWREAEEARLEEEARLAAEAEAADVDGSADGGEGD